MSGSLKKGVCLVAGAGPGIGLSVAKKFAREGLTVVVARRNKEEILKTSSDINNLGFQGICHGLGCDFRKENSVQHLLEKVEADYGPLLCAVHNMGANIGHVPIADTSTRVYTKIWEMAALSAFLLIREAGTRMTQRGEGTILVTGATASTRGAAGFSAFSSAKMAKRAVVQSAARELGPQGVHVAHVIVDGVVDNPSTRAYFAQKDEKFAKLFDERAGDSCLIQPDSVANLYWQLYTQDKSVWTHEVDVRPWKEKW